MSNNQNTLREALNQFTITGTLKENTLEIRDDLKDRATGAPYKAIMGDLVVKVNEHDEHRIKLFSKELTKAGAVSKLFKAYETVMDTYISIADLATMSAEEKEGKYATRLTVQGEIRSNDYSADGTEVRETPELAGKFINSIKEEEDDKAEFDLEVYLQAIKPELDKAGIETGRLEIKGLVPVYGGKIIPIPLTITDEHGVADYMQMNFQVGDTLQIWGEIINQAIEKKKVKSGFGQSKEDISYDYKNEILVIGGEERPLEGDKAFDTEAIKLALKEREAYLEQKKAEGARRGEQPKKTAGFARAASKTPVKREIDPNNIPF